MRACPNLLMKIVMESFIFKAVLKLGFRHRSLLNDLKLASVIFLFFFHEMTALK